jgi:hypothetical protein
VGNRQRRSRGESLECSRAAAMTSIAAASVARPGRMAHLRPKRSASAAAGSVQISVARARAPNISPAAREPSSALYNEKTRSV